MTKKTSRGSLRGIIAALAALAALAAVPSAAQADKATCPKFTVEHDDTIGKLKLAKGAYTVKIRDDKKVTCAQTTKLLQQFLQDYDGKLGGGWVVKVKKVGFKNNRTGAFFRLTKGGGGGGGGGGSTPHSKCPGTFQVQNNDRIGDLRLPRGPYYTYQLNKESPSCQRITKLFAKFLQRPDGDLPDRWKVIAEQGKFVKRKGGQRIGFRVKPAS
ncbi:hypothetical protein HJD18_11560 [Thermoleophilia bacterium SCSIO 60948]|nr:hypothetical protein HJD18_11560 [Thermoleophilia bacterium SCSIO 60948]